METRNSVLIVGLYSLCVIIIGAACFAYYSYERSANPPPAPVAFNSQALETSNRSTALIYSAAAAKANKSVRDLQLSLAATRDQLAKQTASLNQKNAECSALREQLDHSMTLMLSLLDEDYTRAGDACDTSAEVRAKLDSELASLKQSLGNSESVDSQRELSLMQLQAELIQADLHLESLEQQSQRELDLVLTEKRNVEQTASDVLARCGAVAVPLLAELLSDERVEVRRWAAKALGTIGPEARDATTLLRELLADPDPSVRTEVEQALAKMD